MNQLDRANEIIDSIETTLGQLAQADLNEGLTEAQHEAQAWLRKMYDLLTEDVLQIEEEML